MMTCCGHCRDAGDFFNERTARRDLKRYKRKGPDASTRKLIDGIRKNSADGKTLLDIGGGIGSIPLELFQNDLEKAVNVDASTSYQNVLKKEAKKRGLDDAMEYRFGDFTDLADTIPLVDIVTLDKVICCYPDWKKLVEASLDKSNRVFALVFPRETFFTRMGLPLVNFWFKIRNSDFRTYLHPYEEVDAMIRDHGFNEFLHEKTILWRVLVYEK